MSYFGAEKNAGVDRLHWHRRRSLLSDAACFFSQERARMAWVQRNFLIIQYLEVTVVIVAAIVASRRSIDSRRRA
jgi:hypothetical protein